ncbi:MAG: hypothetical protein A2Z95_02275 [Gallionellales bacterium GWA2_60_18]|nr:MAG: hypothetical protein A2Z95_02275 [Gallionellales bacterium GWA2_60_18]
MFRLLLIFALLFAQSGGMAHGIAHAMAEQTQDHSLPHGKHCSLCAAYAQIGSAVGNIGISFGSTASLEETSTTHSCCFRSTAFTAFAARAPPRSA